MSGWKNKRTVMQRYDLTAEMYEERYAKEQEAKYLAAMQNVSVAGCAVLDAGCGSGLFFSHVAGEAKLVFGVDISRKLLFKAKEQANAFENVTVLQADADHLPFREGFFDIVFAFTVLQNMPKPLVTLGELKRVTKAGGKLVVTGLKKAFELHKFVDILECRGLGIDSFIDCEDLKCYVATLSV